MLIFSPQNQHFNLNSSIKINFNITYKRTPVVRGKPRAQSSTLRYSTHTDRVTTDCNNPLLSHLSQRPARVIGNMLNSSSFCVTVTYNLRQNDCPLPARWCLIVWSNVCRWIGTLHVTGCQACVWFGGSWGWLRNGESIQSHNVKATI